MHELSSPVLRYLGLAAALKWLAERHAISGRMAIKVQEEADKTRELPDDIKILRFLPQENCCGVSKEPKGFPLWTLSYLHLILILIPRW